MIAKIRFDLKSVLILDDVNGKRARIFLYDIIGKQVLQDITTV